MNIIQPKEKQEDFFKKYWKEELISKFNAEVKYDKSSLPKVNDRTFWTEFFSNNVSHISRRKLETKGSINTQNKFSKFFKEIAFRHNGLHKSIQQRDQRIYKRLT